MKNVFVIEDLSLEGLTIELVTSHSDQNHCQPDTKDDGCDPEGDWCVPQVN